MFTYLFYTYTYIHKRLITTLQADNIIILLESN